MDKFLTKSEVLEQKRFDTQVELNRWAAAENLLAAGERIVVSVKVETDARRKHRRIISDRLTPSDWRDIFGVNWSLCYRPIFETLRASKNLPVRVGDIEVAYGGLPESKIGGINEVFKERGLFYRLGYPESERRKRRHQLPWPDHHLQLFIVEMVDSDK